MNYTLHQLRVFQKVVELKSITKAAEALNMTQPAVSIQLKNLQEQFDMPITEIFGRQVHITDFGMELNEVAGRILDEVELIDYMSKQYKGLLAGKLKIASVSTGKYVIPYFLKGFLDMHKGVKLDFDVTNRREVIANLEKNDIDFAVMAVEPEHINLNEEIIMPNTLFVVGSNENSELTLKDEVSLLHREEGSGTRIIMLNFFDKKGINTKLRMQLRSNEAVKQAVIAGLGISVLPVVSMKNELENGQVKIINVEGFPLKSDWKLVWLKNKRLSPVANAFLDYIKENKEEIFRKEFSWMERY